jgi:hypothetical protein
LYGRKFTSRIDKQLLLRDFKLIRTLALPHTPLPPPRGVYGRPDQRVAAGLNGR